MEEIDYYSLEVKKPWKKFQVTFVIVFFLFILLEFDFIEIASFPIFICFWISILVEFYFLINAVITSINYRKIPYQKNLLAIFILILAMPLTNLYRNGFFWGKPVLTGAFLDQFNRSDLELFKNNHYIATQGWMFGSEKYIGLYQQNGDTIRFTDFPLTPDSTGSIKMLRKYNKLLFQTDTSGHYDTSFYYYKIPAE